MLYRRRVPHLHIDLNQVGDSRQHLILVLAALLVPALLPVLSLAALVAVADELTASANEEGRARGAAGVARCH